MSSGSYNNRRRRGAAHGGGGGGGHDGPSERWLLTYADMITLLMALFIVMWSISAVNLGKFNELKSSLKAAFSGKTFGTGDPHVLSGGSSVLQPQGAQISAITRERQSSVETAFKPKFREPTTAIEKTLKERETSNLKRIQAEIQDYAQKHNLESKIQTSIDERGLMVHVLTDDLLFKTGEAQLQPESLPLIDRIGVLLEQNAMTNPIRVEGNTDGVPISTPEFHSNWELSTSRATAVLQRLLRAHIDQGRLSVAGFADQKPIASNATATGRARNRRVDLVVLRNGAS